MTGHAEGEMLAERYVLGPIIGEGSMGQVHLAEDVRLARPVAVKSLRPELARHPEVRERFGHEARAAARINHPNVVRVYDSGEQDGVPYLVMECLPGTSLVDELAWGPLEPRRARRIGLEVLSALEAAHRLNVIHRDVKPGNILLASATDGQAKVSDFGIAKIADGHSRTDSGGLVGTPAYLAPERLAGEAAGPPSDLYSVGVVLYESLAGRKPYEGETSLALALAVHVGGAPSLLELRPDLDPALGAIIDKALAHDPADRWESAAAMGEALRGWRPRGTGRAAAVADDKTTGTPAAALAGAAAAAEAAGAAAAPRTAAAPAASGQPGGGWSGRTVAVAAPPAVGGDRGQGPDGASGRSRRRTGLLCLGTAGLVLALVVVVATRRGPGRAEPGAPPTSAQAGAAPEDTSVPEAGGPAPSSSRVTRPVRRAAAPSSTAAPTAAPRTTTTVRVTTTRRPTTTTTPPTTTTLPSTTAPSTTPTTASPVATP